MWSVGTVQYPKVMDQRKAGMNSQVMNRYKEFWDVMSGFSGYFRL